MPLPTYQQVAERLKELAIERSEWAGLAIPLSDTPLITEPRYPYHLHVDKNLDDEDQGQLELVNQWFSRRLGGNVMVVKDHRTGKSVAALRPWNGTDMLLGTVSASVVWPIDAEIKAMEKLQGLIPEHMFRNYVLAGAIVESSKRSGVTYVFRKLRPTIALKPWKDRMAVLGTLCLHPIGYYSGTWAGVMTPTDDVLAHLILMRGDEPKFWANANQHPAWHPQSGI